VFKLEEIDRRLGLFRAGQRVLDLGAAPGSWSLYASERVGSEGAVLAVDLQPIAERFGPNVTVIQGDALALDGAELGRFAPYDVVLSDMAPKTSGSKVHDHASSFELFTRALEVAIALGGPGSTFVGKLFMSGDFPRAKQALGASYARTRVIRPESTRKESTEVFLVGIGRSVRRSR
jgi:23S rRNA (uridine2552-2'-O)-methyltransferase